MICYALLPGVAGDGLKHQASVPGWNYAYVVPDE